MLSVKDLRVEVEGREVVKGASLEVGEGEVVVLRGPNGSGKSSLARAIMGDSRFRVTGGKILLDGEDITDWPPERRAEKIFLAFQIPPEFEGISLDYFLLKVSGRERDPLAYRDLFSLSSRVGLSPDFLSRSLNKGFSGGEKKRAELLQAMFLDRKYIILDEVDSGMDEEGIKMLGEVVREWRERGKGILVISHHPTLPDFISPDREYRMERGRVV